MVSKTSMALALVLAAWLLAAVPLAQAPGPPITASPAVTFTVRLADDRRQFRPGEIIPIDLEFSSPVPGRFVASGATYDRSGRLTIDEFRVEPFDGVSDPLLDFYAQTGGVIGGGLSSINPLGEEPFVVRLALNEWFRFDRPGTYTLSARSSRVTDEARRTSTDRAIVPLESNAVTFEILPPDAEWASARVVHAVSIIDGPGTDSERREGCRLLRFLASEAAVEQMIRRFDDGQWGCDFDYMAGLFAAPNRAHVVRRLEERLVAPDQAVSVRYLRTLAALSLYVQHPELRPAQTADTVGRFARGELSRRGDLLDAGIERYTAILMPALPAKGPRARAFSLAGLLDQLSAGPAGARAGAQLRNQVAAAFLDLPLDRQRTLLEQQWRRFGGPEMLPALRHLVSASPGAASPAFDLALRRLYELAPEEARPMILREMRNPRRGVTVATLGLLPDRELPELDGVLVAGLAADADDIAFELVERYASRSVAARLQASFGGRIGRMPCRPQAALLAYFLRVDRPAGRMLLETALTTRADTRCYTSVLGEVASRRTMADIETLAIRHLGDDEPDVVANAAEALGRFGSADALPALRSRLEQWSRQWAGRQEELVYRDPRPNPPAAHAMVEFSLVQAIGRGQAWHLDGAALRGVESLCVTDSCRQQVNQMLESAEHRVIRVHWLDEPQRSSISIAQYDLRSLEALEQKLAQFPRGSSFTLDVSALDADSAATATARVRAASLAHGLFLK
jgi:hypothetical protein